MTVLFLFNVSRCWIHDKCINYGNSVTRGEYFNQFHLFFSLFHFILIMHSLAEMSQNSLIWQCYLMLFKIYLSRVKKKRRKIILLFYAHFICIKFFFLSPCPVFFITLFWFSVFHFAIINCTTLNTIWINYHYVFFSFFHYFPLFFSFYPIQYDNLEREMSANKTVR